MILKTIGLVGLGIALTAAAASAKEAATPAPSPQEIVDQAPASAWKDIPADDIVIMRLADGNIVTYQLASAMAPVHVANIRQLIRSGYFDGASILRVQDNYVVQWGRPDEDPTKPSGIVAAPPAEYETALKGVSFKALHYPDTYAAQAGYIQGWPAATDGKSVWLVHCYGMIGVARDVPPSTGDATQLYTVIGQAPRHLDRNLALVGRVLGGMEALTDQKRGAEALGFYKMDAERLKIVSTKVASDLPLADRPVFQAMDTSAPAFDSWVRARANRSQAFFVRPAKAMDICNAQVPVRKTH